MAAKVQQYIAETCKMQHSFAWAFRICANRIFHSISTIYCSFHSASHSCGSDEGSLQPSLWLTKVSSILLKLAKCSKALNAPVGVASIELFTQFLQYTSFSTQPATHVAVMMEASSHLMPARVENYIAETCKMPCNFACIFRSWANRNFR